MADRTDRFSGRISDYGFDLTPVGHPAFASQTAQTLYFPSRTPGPGNGFRGATDGKTNPNHQQSTKKSFKFMKRILLGVLATAAMFGTNHVAAQDKGVSFSGGSDLVSSYYWRGVKESGPALQPTLTMTAGNFSVDRKSTRLNSSHSGQSRMPSSA